MYTCLKIVDFPEQQRLLYDSHKLYEICTYLRIRDFLQGYFTYARFEKPCNWRYDSKWTVTRTKKFLTQ